MKDKADQRSRRGVLTILALLAAALFGAELWAVAALQHRQFLMLHSAILISGIPFCLALWRTFRFASFPEARWRYSWLWHPFPASASAAGSNAPFDRHLSLHLGWPGTSCRQQLKPRRLRG
jgi:hypothetical protein